MAESLYLEDLTAGLSRSISRTIHEEDIESFGALSGDRNPVHFDEVYAASTQFGGRIAHGMLGASLISTVIGMQLPGKGAIYLGQTLKFRAPVRAGDKLHVVCTVREILREKRRVTIDCVCKVGETTVIEGEALILVPSRSA